MAAPHTTWRTGTLVAIALLLGAVAASSGSTRMLALRVQGPSTAAPVSGSWAATGAGPTLQGTWTAQPVPNNPNAAQGSWTLVSANRITARGTWSAVKTPSGWSGSWQARVAGSNRIISGTWRADVTAPNGTPLMELLQSATDQQVSGTWAHGRLRGAWSVRRTR